ncbi:MAG: hypothetical protein JJ975_03090 [Bacteroidia bacterium]|nr:hypothetical protein [Bacteroidia bacterium]
MKRIKYALYGILACIVIYLMACTGAQSPEEEEEVTTLDFEVNFNPFPPKDLSANASDTDLVKFAWEEFLALNWKSSYTENSKRDYPDLNWRWNSDSSAYPDLLVWETYAHRTELRPYDDQMLPFDAPPHYSFGETLYPANGASFTLFNNLDENNEIGSCDVYGHVSEYDKDDMVLYQAKVNRDEYEYIYNNYNTKAKLLSATSNTLSNIDAYNAYYPGAGSTCNCPVDSNVICLPCGDSPIPGKSGETYQGAMEIKTAWRILVPEDDPSKYLTREVIVYEKSNDSIYYDNKVLALIGIHIIHKTTNYPDYVFATWEHKSVQDNDMGYVLLDASGNETGPIHANYPRLHPIPPLVEESTRQVHQQIAAMNPNSIWLNYRLVGVQGAPTNDTSSFSFFLANYVIESDTTLADFHGSSIGNPHDGQPNILLNGTRYSMGGCKGCHGVAQLTLGTDMSFLLDTVGKPVVAPDVLEHTPSAVTLSKLERYKQATAR